MLRVTRPSLIVVLRHRWFLAICAFAGLTLGVLYVESQDRIYSVKCRIHIANLALEAPAFTESTDHEVARVHTAILRSRRSLSVAAKSLSGNSILNGIKAPVEWLHSNVRFEISPKDDKLTVSLDSTRQVEACAIVNAIVRSYMSSLRALEIAQASVHWEEQKWDFVAKERERRAIMAEQRALVDKAPLSSGVVASEAYADLENKRRQAFAQRENARKTLAATVTERIRPKIEWATRATSTTVSFAWAIALFSILVVFFGAGFVWLRGKLDQGALDREEEEEEPDETDRK